MADSDNSRTLSPVTRGNFHSVVGASLPTCHDLAAPLAVLQDAPDDDPAMLLWHEWRIAWHHLSESTLRQQRLERSLFSVVLPPSLEQAAGAQGYNEALKAEDRASVAEEQAAEALWAVPAMSIAGAVAKLHAIVSKWQPSPTSQEAPWPQLRSAIADFLRIDSASVANGRNLPSMPEIPSEFRNG
ncbi:hypothetical protein IB279_29130 [Ensifer sp. ENS06]|uniref:hypothetical protein n=1 Tax=Ensifer sp. ENS06 TaxID=2769276 RepID=UPI00177CA3D6|nr:hypothetical protein [Ensifer sp. ENS06]MBD9627018.1 hypothetical protein [Ensifer sp. ENS06]